MRPNWLGERGRHPLQRTETPAATPAVDGTAALDAAPTLRILAAEDNAMNQLVLKTLLSQLGLEPTLLGDGEQAVRACEQGDWDLILVDVQMPVMDGATATRRLRDRERETGRRRTPVIALRANAMSHHADEYRRAGMDVLVPKPIRLGELVQAIQSVLEPAGEGAAMRRGRRSG